MNRVRRVLILRLLGSLIFSAAPIAASASLYSLTVLSNNPVAYWRLDEGPDNGAGNDGLTAHDYVGGHNATYTNVILGMSGYNPLVDLDTAALFGVFALSNSHAGEINLTNNGIANINFATPSGANAEFSVEAWVNSTNATQISGAGIVAKGPGHGEQFDLDVYGGIRFFVRNAGGTVSSAISSVVPTVGQWYHLVGVCDESNGLVHLYINGVDNINAAITAGTGLNTAATTNTALPGAALVSIGARTSGQTTYIYDYQFQGKIDEVAIYNYALSARQVVADYQAGIATLQFTNSTLRNPNLILAGLGGAGNGIYTFLASTNLTLPLTNWTTVATNSFDGNGRFNLTNPMNRSVKQQFYALQALPVANALWIPTCGAWLGNTYYNSTTVEGRTGRQLDFLHFYNGTQTNLTSTELSLIATGQKLLINFIPATNWSWAVGVARGGRASVDLGMTNFARSVASIKPAKVMLTILGEQERYVTGGGGNEAGAGTTNQFVEMWQNVWNTFQAEGATNVIWFWDVEGSWLDSLYGGLWPGNNYVDWVMWDPYQDSSQAYTNKLMGIYNWFLAHSTAACDWADKPWGLAEWGIGLNTNWIPTAADQTAAFNQMNAAVNNNQFPKLKLLAYFDETYSLITNTAFPAYSNFCNSPYMEQQCSP